MAGPCGCQGRVEMTTGQTTFGTVPSAMPNLGGPGPATSVAPAARATRGAPLPGSVANLAPHGGAAPRES